MARNDHQRRIKPVAGRFFSYPVGPRLRLQSHLALDPRQEFANSLPVAAPIQMHEFGQVVALTACELATTSNSASTALRRRRPIEAIECLHYVDPYQARILRVARWSAKDSRSVVQEPGPAVLELKSKEETLEDAEIERRARQLWVRENPNRPWLPLSQRAELGQDMSASASEEDRKRYIERVRSGE